MAAITVYAQSSGDWDKANNWDTVAGGGGTDYTDPQDGTDSFTCDLNGYAINLNKTVVVTKIQATAAGGTIVVPNSSTPTIGNASGVKTQVTSSYAGTMLTWGTGTCSLTINGSVLYSSTSTSGMFTVGASQTITVQNTGGAGTTAMKCSSSGYTLLASSSGTFIVTNSGGTALEQTSSGRVIMSTTTSSSCAITGLCSTTTTAGRALDHGTGAATISITGNVSASSTAPAVSFSAGTLNWSDGLPISAANNAQHAALTISGGTLNWTGTLTVASGEQHNVVTAGGTINAGTAGTALAITNNGGQLLIIKRSGTLTTTYMTITDTAADSQSMVFGQTFTVTKQNLSAGNVKSGVTILGTAGSYTGTAGGGVPVFGGSVVRRV